MSNNIVNIETINTYKKDTNGNMIQKEYMKYEDSEKKIEKMYYNGKPYWKKTETKKPLFRKHVHFVTSSPLHSSKSIQTRKINRIVTPYYPKKSRSYKKRNSYKNREKK